jgi:CHAD domain-containing protein
MQTALQKYFAQRVKNLFNHLHDFDLNGDEVSLHDFRVEMKKLRAIIKFLRQVYAKQKLKKSAHLLRSIFEISGEIREYQILQQWLQKHGCNEIEQHYFPTDKLEVMLQQFRFNSEKYTSVLTGIIEDVSVFVQSTNEILPEQYFSEMNAKVEKLCRKNLSTSDWHELRKFIKQRIYSYNWFMHDDENDDPAFAYYNRLQEQIGQWHDVETVKNIFSQKQIYLSQDIEVQKDFNLAWEKLNSSLKYREKIVEDMLAKQIVND